MALVDTAVVVDRFLAGIILWVPFVEKKNRREISSRNIHRVNKTMKDTIIIALLGALLLAAYINFKELRTLRKENAQIRKSG
jgi:hypothetical protein